MLAKIFYLGAIKHFQCHKIEIINDKTTNATIIEVISEEIKIRIG
jgi:hypothetical protein